MAIGVMLPETPRKMFATHSTCDGCKQFRKVCCGTINRLGYNKARCESCCCVKG